MEECDSEDRAGIAREIRPTNTEDGKKKSMPLEHEVKGNLVAFATRDWRIGTSAGNKQYPEKNSNDRGRRTGTYLVGKKAVR